MSKVSLLFLCVLGGLAGRCFSAEWIAVSGSIVEESNWFGNTLPEFDDEALINNGGIAIIDDSLEVNRLTIGLDDGSGFIEQNGGTFAAVGAFIGDNAAGSAKISGGLFEIGSDSIHVGWRPGGVGEMTIDGPDAIVLSGDDFQLGREGSGTLNFSAGTLRAGYTVVGKFGTGIWNQTGGLFDQDFGDIEIADGGTDDQAGTPGPREGTLNLAGGIIQSSGHVAIGNRRGTGVMNVSGGIVAATGSGNSSIFIGRGNDTTPGEGGPVEMRITGGDAIIVANGDFVMNASESAVSSALIAEITGTSHTPIRVAGSADIENGNLIVELSDYLPSSGDNWVLIEAGVELDDDLDMIDAFVDTEGYEPLLHEFPEQLGTVLGEFASVDTSMAQLLPGLSWEVSYVDELVVLQVVGAASLLGDFDASGDLDAADIDALTNAVRQMTNAVEFDVNQDGTVDGADRAIWVNELKSTFFGDSNLDGEFNSSDFVAVFQAGQYEDGIPNNSTWASGDWNGDGEFDSGDFVVAFQTGGFETGPRAATQSVPEPKTSMLLLALVMLAYFKRQSLHDRSEKR